ncbi:hypothetical protein [Frankia sp. Cj3]|uniref:hypothetical protein n=1 Tax=Frankia sp. Cj3 TaxID=2880976 RepID=UPI001EF606DE|nr:hypothetical protein [Frankia sp. Cj3]
MIRIAAVPGPLGQIVDVPGLDPDTIRQEEEQRAQLRESLEDPNQQDQRDKILKAVHERAAAARRSIIDRTS